MRLLHWISSHINWPVVIALAGLLLAAGFNNLLAAVLWVAGLFYGYVQANIDEGNRS